MPFKIIFFILLINHFNFGYSNSNLNDNDLKVKIDNFLTSFLECRNFTGGALAVVRNGKILMTKGYGYSNKAENEYFNPDTKFAIASITKSFTAHLLLKLLEEKGLSNLYLYTVYIYKLSYCMKKDM